jgi:hypothetical protein
MNEVTLVNANELYAALQELHNANNKTDWILLEYGKGPTDIQLSKKGTGGIDAFKGELRLDAVQYVVVQVVINSDDYNPMKNCLIAWIGPNVKAGLLKARAAGQRAKLFELITEKGRGIPIASQFAADKYEDITSDSIASSITRISSKYGTATKATEERKAMSKESNTTTGQIAVVDRSVIETALKGVHTQKHDWAILSYVKGEKSQIELLATGTGGVEGLKAHWPTDRILYCIVRLASEQEKIVLLTLIGSEVKPMEKARSGVQRHEMNNYVLTQIPLHGEYQPNDASDLNTANILSKFK